MRSTEPPWRSRTGCLLRAKPLDFAVVAVVAALIAACAVTVYRPGAGRPVVQVESSRGREYLSLDHEARVRIPGPLGVTVVEVHDGRVRIEHSPCENQQCVRMGWVGPEGGWVACLPNRVFVRVKRGAVGGVVRARTRPDPGGDDARIW